MYGKEEAQKLRKEFWTTFGVYMQKHRPLLGNKTRWVNYRTGIRHMYFRLKADNKTAAVSIELQHKDEEIRQLYWEQLCELKTLLTASLPDEYIWDEKQYNDAGMPVSVVYSQIKNVNIYDKNTWKEIFSFFERNMLALDEFWYEFKPIFKQLDD